MRVHCACAFSFVFTCAFVCAFAFAFACFMGVPVGTFVSVLCPNHSMIHNDFHCGFCDFTFENQSTIMIIIMRYHQLSASSSL